MQDYRAVAEAQQMTDSLAMWYRCLNTISVLMVNTMMILLTQTPVYSSATNGK